MLEVTKNYVLDTNQQPVAVQIPIAEFVGFTQDTDSNLTPTLARV